MCDPYDLLQLTYQKKQRSFFWHVVNFSFSSLGGDTIANTISNLPKLLNGGRPSRSITPEDFCITLFLFFFGKTRCFFFFLSFYYYHYSNRAVTKCLLPINQILFGKEILLLGYVTFAGGLHFLASERKRLLYLDRRAQSLLGNPLAYIENQIVVKKNLNGFIFLWVVNQHPVVLQVSVIVAQHTQNIEQGFRCTSWRKVAGMCKWKNPTLWALIQWHPRSNRDCIPSDWYRVDHVTVKES